MSILVNNEYIEEKLLADRLASGEDQNDEVWEGVYFMAPDPDLIHQKVVTYLSMILNEIVASELRGNVFTSCNVSDREVGWKQNYRRPDIAAFLADTKAKFHGTYVVGGPDFAVEVASNNDRTWEKLDFYASNKSREVLIVDRDPWELTLLRWDAGKMKPVGTSSPGNDQPLVSEVIPLSFRLIWRGSDPEIEVKHLHDGRIWHAPAKIN